MSVGRFEFKKVAKYPHMKPEDIAVWERFIDKNPAFFETVDYDVRVGKGAPQDPNLPANIQYDGTVLTQKKIDAVAYDGPSTYVIEIGPVADMRKLGQILTYGALYRSDHPDVTDITLMVVAGALERELEDIFKANGVVVKIA